MRISDYCPRCGAEINVSHPDGDLLDNGYLGCPKCKFSWTKLGLKDGRIRLTYWSPNKADYTKVPDNCLAVWDWEPET